VEVADLPRISVSFNIVMPDRGWSFVETEMIRTFDFDDSEVAFYNTEGYLYLPGLVERDTAGAIRTEVLDLMSRAFGFDNERLSSALDVGDKLRQTRQYLRNSHIDGLVNSAALCKLAGALMEGPSTMHSPFTAVKTGGGAGSFHLHQDNQYSQFDGPGIGVWIALQEMSPENGCLIVAPRSHQSGTLGWIINPDGDQHRTVEADPGHVLPVRMNPGDAVAFNRLTVHGSGPNTTGEPRVAYAVQFHRDDVNLIRDGEPPRRLKDDPLLDDKGPRDSIERENVN
jgi:phytanoyl-CoA hydroxylase